MLPQAVAKETEDPDLVRASYERAVRECGREWRRLGGTLTLTHTNTNTNTLILGIHILPFFSSFMSLIL